MRRALVGGFLGVWLFPLAVHPAEPAAQKWFEPPELSQPRLSPDGRLVGAFLGTQGFPVWWVRNLASELPAKTGALDPGWWPLEFAWTQDGVALIHAGNPAGDSQWWRSDEMGSRLRRLPVPKGMSWVRLLQPQPSLASEVLIEGHFQGNEAAGERRRWLDVLSVPLDGRPPTLAARNPGDVVEWLADDSGRVRVALGIHDLTQQLRVAADDARQVWRPVMSFDFLNDPARLLNLSADGNRAWFAARMGRDTRGVYELDVPGRRIVRATWTDSEFDFDGHVVVAGQEIRAVSFEAERPETAWFDRQWPSVLTGRPSWQPMVLIADGRRGLFFESRDQEAGRWYWMEIRLDSPQALDPRNSLLSPKGAVMEPVRWAARDGVALQGYLTRPSGSEQKPPLIVLVHGGPWSRDTWGWQAEVQFLVSRGWAVLQVNYRGSAGFGREFQERGAGNWGRAADDLVDGACWVTAQEWADGERMTVAGASFGGFLAVLALTREGQPFRAAASLGGVFDLRDSIRELRRREPGFVVAAQRQWLLGAEPDMASLQVAAEAVRNPVLLLHAQDDTRVSWEQSVRMAEALRQRQRPVTLELLASGGHSMGTPIQQGNAWERVETFLREKSSGARVATP